MSDTLPRAGVTPRILPIFPLPDTVLFPRTTMPLHIFEPRYRAMVQDVTAGDGLIVVSLISGDGFLGLGTVGRVRDLEPLDDGRFNLRLEGLERVSLVEVPGDALYRQVRVEPRPERTGTEDAGAIAEARLELMASYGILRGMIIENEPLALHQGLPFEVVVNTACAGLPIEASARQRLLTEDSLMERQRLGLEYLSSIIELLSSLHTPRSRGSSMMN